MAGAGGGRLGGDVAGEEQLHGEGDLVRVRVRVRVRVS